MNSFLKIVFFLVALIIALGSLFYTNRLVAHIRKIEKQRVELWAEAYAELVSTDISQNISNVVFKMIESNSTIPVIIVDNQGDIITYANIDSTQAHSVEYLGALLKKMRAQHQPIPIDMGEYKNYVYYLDSSLLTELQRFPIVQIIFVSLFLIVVLITLHFSKKAEEGRLLVGMSNETAHQLGTPISSLLAWIELLKMQENDSFVYEVEKDVKRLLTITERFSRIGSKPKLESTKLIDLINETVDYLRKRTSKKIEFEIKRPQRDIILMLNPYLFSWVIENLWKNAVDSMAGIGKITIRISEKKDNVIIDFRDTGKGISRKMFKKIFRPGFTTKKRGWGLGLTLTKRIIEDYHGGKIYVRYSEPSKGTTFRIILKR